MKTISITATNRPHYLREVLASLALNDCSGYELHFAIEPTGVLDEIVALCESVDWMPRHLHINPQVLGVRDNPYQLLARVFEAGSVQNIYLEDDVIVSPDATKLANWFLETQDAQAWLTLNLLNYKSRVDDPCGLIPSKQLSALGLVISAYAWRTWISNIWYDDALAMRVYKNRWRIGWDWSIRAFLKENPQIRTLVPRLSRSNHIGRVGGVYCEPAFHDSTFSRLPINQNRDVGSYIVRPEPVWSRLTRWFR